MAYALSLKSTRGIATLYARIKDKETGYFWSETGSVWLATATAACNLTLTESATEPGVYTGSATFTPENGGVYLISVYDSADANYAVTTIEMYPSKTKTVLEVINAIQLEMKMPQSTALTDKFAQIILAKMNKILKLSIPDRNILDHLKVQGSFSVNTGKSVYRIAPVNVDVLETITFLQLSDQDPVIRAKDDDEFRALSDNYIASSTTGQPEMFRISHRDYGFPIIEIAPFPDAAYTINYEGIKSPIVLTAVGQYVPFADAVETGAHALMLSSQGRDASVEANLHQIALDRAATIGANSEMGDVEV